MKTASCEVCGRVSQSSKEQDLLNKVGLCIICNPAHRRPPQGHQVASFGTRTMRSLVPGTIHRQKLTTTG